MGRHPDLVAEGHAGSGFRFTFGFVEVTGESAEVRVTPVDESGEVTLDEDGGAAVEQPDGGDGNALEIGYQLTCGDGFAPVHVAEGAVEGRISMARDRPGLRVSCLVTDTGRVRQRGPEAFRASTTGGVR